MVGSVLLCIDGICMYVCMYMYVYVTGSEKRALSKKKTSIINIGLEIES